MKVPPNIMPGMYDGIPNKDYHAGPGISSSELKVVRKSPAHFWANSIWADRPEKEPTPAMRFGSAAHKMLLEPDDFEDEFLILPRDVARGTRAEAEYIDELQPWGQDVITFDEYVTIRDMAETAWNNPYVANALSGGITEASGYWNDPRTGLLCKYRPDYRKPGCIVDYKTSGDISINAFASSIAKFGYHQSAAHYLDGDRVLHGTDHDLFIFIAQEKDPPYLVEVFVLDADSIELGRRMNHAALSVLADCMAKDHWPTNSANGPLEIGVPAYEKRKLGG